MNKRLTSNSRLPTLRWTQWALFLIIVLAFALRLYNLDSKSLWSDEGLSLGRAEQSFSRIFQNLNLIPITPDYHDGVDRDKQVVETHDLHPPFYFLLVHFWIQVAGKSEFALRFLSVVGATLAIPLFYTLARALLSQEAGVWAALLSASSPFYLWHAQEVRMYTWVVILSLASVYTFLLLLRDTPCPRDYLFYAVITLVLLYTHYSGFLLLAFEIIVYGVCRLRERPRGVWVLVGVIILLVPLLPYAWRMLQRQGVFGFAYRPLYRIFAEAINAFSLGLGEPVIRPVWQIAPFLILFTVGVLMVDVSHRRQIWLICLGYLILPVLFLYLLSLYRPNYMNPRHLMIVSPAWELILAQGLVTLRRRFWPGLVIILGAVLLLRGQANYDIFAAHSMWKDDIRGAVAYIEERARPGDAIVLHDGIIRPTFDYYYQAPYPETAIPRYDRQSEVDRALEEFKTWARRYDRIWFMYGPPPLHFPRDLLLNWADANQFKVYEQKFEAWWTYVGVAAYDDAPPLFDALPEYALSRDLDLGSLQLVGFHAPETTAGETAWLEFYWRAGGDLPDEPLMLAVKLTDEAGNVWLDRTEQALSFYAPAQWPTDQIVKTEFHLPLPEDMPPVDFTVNVEAVGLAESHSVGQMTVTRPAVRPSVSRPRARFGEELELVTGEFVDDRFRAGYSLLGSLTWRTVTTPTADCYVRMRLIDLWGREIAVGEMLPSATGFPTSAWRPGDLVAGHLQLNLPADLKSGRYWVQMALLGAADGAPIPVRRWYGKHDWLTLGSVRVDAWPLMDELPDDIAHPLEDVRLAEAVHLRGYDLESASRVLTLTLYWQAEQPLGTNYHVFVHLGKPDAAPIAQADGVPVGWLRPTTTWRADEVIVDTYTIPLSQTPPGQYDLLVGFYDPQTGGQRPMTVVNGEVIPGGYVLLQKIEVAR